MKMFVLAAMFAASVATMTGIGSARAQTYPSRPVTFVVPSTAGGDADLAGRNLAAAAEGVLKRPVVIVNKVGAAGAIGSQFVKDVSNDGYRQLEAIVGWSALYGPPNMNREAFAKWTGVFRYVASDAAWIAVEEKIRSIPRILPPRETEEIVAEQFEVYERLGQELKVELN